MANVFYCASTILQAFFVIFFILQFFNKKSLLRTPYFVIYEVGLIISVITNFEWIFWGLLPERVSQTVTVYSCVFPVTLHATLIFNRCTALWFPLKVNKIWSNKNTSVIIMFNLILPYFMFGFYFYQVYFVEVSENQKYANEHINSIIQIYFTTISIILIIITVIICSKRKITTFSDKFAQIEKRLIYQSIVVLLLIELDCLIWKIDNIIDFGGGYFPDIVYEIGDCIIPIYQLFDIIILFILSESFRTSVLKFVTFGFYEPAKVIMVISITNSQTLKPQFNNQRSLQK